MFTIVLQFFRITLHNLYFFRLFPILHSIATHCVHMSILRHQIIRTYQSWLQVIPALLALLGVFMTVQIWFQIEVHQAGSSLSIFVCPIYMSGSCRQMPTPHVVSHGGLASTSIRVPVFSSNSLRCAFWTNFACNALLVMSARRFVHCLWS